MGFDSGFIVLCNETGTGKHYAGHRLSGKVIFDQNKEQSFRSIYIRFKGSCHVHWSDGCGQTRSDYDSREEYVNQKICLVGSEHGQQTISPGHYEYPFQFMIPEDCPSSYDGKYGHVRYNLKAVLDRKLRLDEDIVKVVKVIAPLDLNLIPSARKPITIEFEDIYFKCCTRSGSVTGVVNVPYGGFVPGQTIPVLLTVQVTGSVSITIVLSVVKKTTFYGYSWLSKYTRVLNEDEVQCLVKVPADTDRTSSHELPLLLEDAGNLFDCSYIDVNYQLKVNLIPDGCYFNSSSIKDIEIGTIPITGSNFSTSGRTASAQQNGPVINQPRSSHYPEAMLTRPGTSAPYSIPASYPNNNANPGSVAGNPSGNGCPRYSVLSTAPSQTGLSKTINHPSSSQYAAPSAPQLELIDNQKEM